MYERFEPSERIFVDREEYLEWMDEALQRCKERSVVLYLRGIGGIGKSSLLDYWTRTIEFTIRLDCEHHSEFLDRLNVLAKGAVVLGTRLPRFDILWQIRQRFVEGVEPVKESGREWAKDVVMAIPFIGSMAAIGSAISSVGAKVAPKLKGRFGGLGEWLQTRLGSNYLEKLLEILWKEPRWAEFLYLDALLEDLNDRKTLDVPILLLLDHFEYVDDEALRWRYSGQEISEAQLWRVLLSSLSNCVGVIASRSSFVDQLEVGIEEAELTELDRESCLEFLEMRGVKDTGLQERIVSVSGGNPFVIGTFCDMIESSPLSPESVESLRADTLEKVRLKTWRRLFNEVQDLQGLVNRAGLLPYFSRRVMHVAAPDMNTDQWIRMIQLSFAKDRGDGTYVMHDLAKDLAVAELGGRLHVLADEVAELLEKTAEEQEDFELLGLSISVQGLHSPESALRRMDQITNNQSWRFEFRSAVELLDSVTFGTLREQTMVSLNKAWHLTWLDRVAEAEHLLKEAIDVLEKLTEADPRSNQVHLMGCFRNYGVLLHRMKQPAEAETMFERALRISKDIDPAFEMNSSAIMYLCWWYSDFLRATRQFSKAADLLRWALDLIQYEKDSLLAARNRAFTLMRLGHVLLDAGQLGDAETAFKEVLETETEFVNRINSQILLGHVYRLTSRLEEAEQMYRESLDSIRIIHEQDEDVHQARTTYYLLAYALALKLAGKYSKAESHYIEALEISRATVGASPEVYLQDLSLVLNDSAILYHETRQFSQAGEYFKEALDNYERLSRNWPDRFESSVAWTLNNYSILLRETGEEASARKLYHRALDIARELVQKHPEAVFFSHLLGVVLNNLGVLSMKAKETTAAEKALREALEIRQALAERTPDVFLSSVATTLNNLGVVLAITNRLPEAREVLQQGLEIRRSLVKRSPEMHNGRSASVLNNLGNVYRLSEEYPKAKKCYQEALELLEDLAALAPSAYQRKVTMVQSNLLRFYREQKETERAESIERKLGFDIEDGQEAWIEEEDTSCGV